MDAYSLAKEFQQFIQNEWPRVIAHEARFGNDLGESDLWEFFRDWAEEVHLVRRLSGNRVLVLQTWAVVSAWFIQKPEDFEPIRRYVTVPLDIVRYWSSGLLPPDIRP
jgi:hypothetical protein